MSIHQGEHTMLDYVHIMLNARKAKLDERGASAVEYGLLIAGIAALIILVIFAFGGVLNNLFDNTCSSINNQGNSGGTCS
jgi:pilus assembly protein Flp/PilA